MGRSNAGKNVVVTGYFNVVDHVSLHSADPGTTGINKLSGGSPAYADLARPSFTAPTTGLISFQLDFNIGASSQPTFVGFWDVANNFLEGQPIPSPPPAYSSQGIYHLTVNAQGQ